MLIEFGDGLEASGEELGRIFVFLICTVGWVLG